MRNTIDRNVSLVGETLSEYDGVYFPANVCGSGGFADLESNEREAGIMANPNFDKDFPYAATFIKFQGLLVDYERIVDETNKGAMKRHDVKVQVLGAYNELLNIIQKNNLRPSQ